MHSVIFVLCMTKFVLQRFKFTLKLILGFCMENYITITTPASM